MNKYFLDGLRVLAKNTNPNRPITINEMIRTLEMALIEKEIDDLNNDLYVVAASIGGWNQNPIFTGTYEECAEYMEDNPCLGYGNDNTAVYPADEWEVDYL